MEQSGLVAYGGLSRRRAQPGQGGSPGRRRPSVTAAALQKDGLSRYQRGRIRIVDRAALNRLQLIR